MSRGVPDKLPDALDRSFYQRLLPVRRHCRAILSDRKGRATSRKGVTRDAKNHRIATSPGNRRPMSPRARTTAPKRSGSTTRRASTAKRGKGHTALDRLTKSVDAAQDALKDLRGEMSKGSSSVLKDLDKQLKDARKSLHGSSKSVLKDLEGLQQKLPGRGGAKKSSTARKSTSSRSSTARKSSSTSRASASRSSSARKSSSSGSKSSPRARTTAPRARAKKS